MSEKKLVPDGYHTLVAVYCVKGADEFLTFLKEGLGGEALSVRRAPDESVMHADVKIGDTVVWVTESVKEPATSSAAAYFVRDCDATFDAAVRAGAKVLFPPKDMPWGHRLGRVEDRWGNGWTFATVGEPKKPD
jgi:PhnB protein